MYEHFCSYNSIQIGRASFGGVCVTVLVVSISFPQPGLEPGRTLNPSTTVNHKASLPATQKKQWPLQSKGNQLKVTERVTSPIEH
jgi:hypothetical protein